MGWGKTLVTLEKGVISSIYHTMSADLYKQLISTHLDFPPVILKITVQFLTFKNHTIGRPTWKQVDNFLTYTFFDRTLRNKVLELNES